MGASPAFERNDSGSLEKADVGVMDLERSKDGSLHACAYASEEDDTRGWKPTAEESAIEKKLKRKVDIFVLPVLTIVYLFNALDKGNIGYAKTDTLVQDLHLKGQEYYLTTMIFYVPFCLCGVPLSLVIKRFSAARVLPILMVGFGSISLLTCATTNFGGLMTLRLLLGICESPMLAGVVFYLSTFYTRNELAGRVGIFYAAASISGAFSGLIAYGVFKIDHPSVSSCFTFGVPLVSVNTFLPQIVARLGYDSLKTSLYTVAPNVVGTVFLVIVTQSSDHFRERGLHICGCVALGLVGWIVLALIDPTNVRANYGAMFLVTMGAFAPSVLTASWYSNNTAGESRRAVLAAVMVAIANSAGLVSTNIFRTEWEPKYTPSLAITATFSGLCLVITFCWTMYMRWDNKRRNYRLGTPKRRPQDVSTKALALGAACEEFLWQP